MLGLMQQQPLLVSSFIRHAARNHATVEVISRLADDTIHRTNYAEVEQRSRRLARALQRLGVRHGDRVATLAWNSHRHLELYYAVSGMGAVCHTVNPRLALDDIAYIVNHAEDVVLFADAGFAALVTALAPLVRETVRSVALLADPTGMPDITLAPGMRLACYETLMAEADADYDWPEFDENTAAALCYTSGTTGRPKGVLYSHRSTAIHALGANQPDVFGIRATDRVLLCTPMFHACGWSIPYIAPMAGAAQIYPGRHLDGASLHYLAETERATFSMAVPTVWLGVLQHLRDTGGKLTTLRRLFSGGSAVPEALFRAYAEYGTHIIHAWGMTEMSPLGVANLPNAATAGLPPDAAAKLQLKQGRGAWGVDMKIADAEGNALPWDGVAFGDVYVRGPWICREYYRHGPDGAAAPDGWFATGDVGTIDPHGYLELVDRSKDVIKSGGEWISSIVLENIAVSHPDVAEAATIAARHPKWLERPLLLVVPKPGRRVEPDSVLALFKGQVATWWIPDAVLVLDELPHSATGKLNKVALRERYGDHLLAGQVA
ncbi:MAG TPA: long-chain-fatty-acid--CoA ligase [Acetobacteraceae bacterium]|nr:long-chain-fatty-acid--CoA ligase [Acetobacteraceae bacterium]